MNQNIRRELFDALVKDGLLEAIRKNLLALCQEYEKRGYNLTDFFCPFSGLSYENPNSTPCSCGACDPIPETFSVGSEFLLALLDDELVDIGNGRQTLAAEFRNALNDEGGFYEFVSFLI